MSERSANRRVLVFALLGVLVIRLLAWGTDGEGIVHAGRLNQTIPTPTRPGGPVNPPDSGPTEGPGGPEPTQTRPGPTTTPSRTPTSAVTGTATVGPTRPTPTTTSTTAATATALSTATGTVVAPSATAGAGITRTPTGTASATATLQPGVGLAPRIRLVKSADPEHVPAPGGSIHFTVQVSNESAPGQTLSLLGLEDDIYGDITDPANPNLSRTDCVLGPIRPGDTYLCGFDAEVTGNPGDRVVNTLIVTAEEVGGAADSTGDRIAVASARAIVTIIDGPTVTQAEPAGAVGAAATETSQTARSTDTATPVSTDKPAAKEGVFLQRAWCVWLVASFVLIGLAIGFFVRRRRAP